ncbi:MAG: hypothetical protein ACLU8F_05200 [Clostridia bacterium]
MNSTTNVGSVNDKMKHMPKMKEMGPDKKDIIYDAKGARVCGGITIPKERSIEIPPKYTIDINATKEYMKKYGTIEIALKENEKEYDR